MTRTWVCDPDCKGNCGMTCNGHLHTVTTVVAVTIIVEFFNEYEQSRTVRLKVPASYLECEEERRKTLVALELNRLKYKPRKIKHIQKEN